MEKGLQTWFAAILGAVLLLVGIIGFVNDPVLGLFNVNGLHNVVHLLSGAIGIWAGVWGGILASRWFNKVFGIVYLLVAVLGFTGLLTGLLDVNAADNWLHVLLGIIPIGIGFWGKD
jgi:hypothetical protein